MVHYTTISVAPKPQGPRNWYSSCFKVRDTTIDTTINTRRITKGHCQEPRTAKCALHHTIWLTDCSSVDVTKAKKAASPNRWNWQTAYLNSYLTRLVRIIEVVNQLWHSNWEFTRQNKAPLVFLFRLSSLSVCLSLSLSLWHTLSLRHLLSLTI